jgi:hypothetical protein
MRDTDLPFQDEDARRALLDATGGWPVLIDRVVDAVTADATRSPQAALDSVTTQLTTHEGASELVISAGVKAQEPVARVWETLVDFDEPAFNDELGELLGDEAGDGAALVDVLRILGALAATDDGRLICEPVLARAWQTAQNLPAGDET